MPEAEEEPPAPHFAGRLTLTYRILAVNILTVALFLLSIFYLDAFRNQIVSERQRTARDEVQLVSAGLAELPQARVGPWLHALGDQTGSRFRIFAPDGRLLIDSWRYGPPTYVLRDPKLQGWDKTAARALDRGFNRLVGYPGLPDFVEAADDRAEGWPEIAEARAGGTSVSRIRLAPDATPVLSAAMPIPGGGALLSTDNDRDITRTVRLQRSRLGIALVLISLLSVLLSIFLARTIVRPLRRLAIAAHRVRLGRAREVRVPLLPARHDEIGTLARALADMTRTLQHRLDNIEAFAADVTHELKNPLASLRSAVDGLERIEDPALRRQLLDVIRQDVLRLDRLVGDIGEAARTDAELARARFIPVDLGELIEQLCRSWDQRRMKGDVRLAFARPRKNSTIVLGEPNRLSRAIDNLIDNAISFSPPGGLVEIAAARVGADVRVRIDDEGPGVPPASREAIFNRFHSVRPEADEFGRHSGLGLAIARAIVEGHDGEISVADRDDAPSGARFIIRLPAAEARS
ncbi:HAMP domain-containing protein [Sphingomonas ginkgonis]|uniref:histidine kinase n=1 Tax=Sphingomonas ginkgonis TaxID=2315330 RepID=A0A3S0EMK2_9SPHN|nr:ATP-binding protein [Sphingomonas ginkgonis]RST30990.1 HAMP domain-containing protein [Sphingomonas ginkgonis]